MGIKNLIKLINKTSAIKYRKLNHYKNKTLGVDANNLINKLTNAIRQNGYELENNGVVYTHIHTLIKYLIAFRKYKINAVFVFDNPVYPKLKRKTMMARHKKLLEYKKLYKKTKDKKYYAPSREITEEEYEDCKELINIFGFQIIETIEESEADCVLAELYKKKEIYGIISDDFDILLFGGGLLLKNFSISLEIQEINLSKLLGDLGINRLKLIIIGILSGCDYEIERIKNIGPIGAYKLVKDSDIDTNNEVIQFFLKPKVNRGMKIKKVGKFDESGFIEFMGDFGYEEEEIWEYLNKVE